MRKYIAFIITCLFPTIIFSQVYKQRLDSIKSERYDESIMQWNDASKSNLTYNTDGLLTNYRYSYWDTNTQEWFIYYQRTFSYDSNGNCTERIHDSWQIDTEQLLSIKRQEYSYDSNGNIVQLISYNLDANQQLDLSYKESYTWNSDNNLIQKYEYLWDTTTQQWTNANQDTLIYNANGVLIEFVREKWDEDVLQFVDENEDEYIYDTYGNRIEKIRSIWWQGQWRRQYQRKSTYDNAYSYNELILPHQPQINIFPYFMYDSTYTKVGFKHKMVFGSVQRWANNQWNDEGIANYYYSEQQLPTTIIKPRETNVVIYPNPSSNFIIFDLENPTSTTVELYDTQGKLICTQSLSADKKLAVGHLPKGVYFYQLQDTNKRYSGKIVVK